MGERGKLQGTPYGEGGRKAPWGSDGARASHGGGDYGRRSPMGRGQWRAGKGGKWGGVMGGDQDTTVSGVGLLTCWGGAYFSKLTRLLRIENGPAKGNPSIPDLQPPCFAPSLASWLAGHGSPKASACCPLQRFTWEKVGANAPAHVLQLPPEGVGAWGARVHTIGYPPHRDPMIPHRNRANSAPHPHWPHSPLVVAPTP